MLVESSFSSSVESSLLNVSEYQDPFATYDWASLAETYQMIHKVPEQSQVSFCKAVPVTDAMNLDESKHPKHHKVPEQSQVSCPEKSVMHKVSGKALTSLVYRRRKRSLKLGGTEEHNLGKTRKQDDSLDDSIVSLHNTGESTKRKTRFNNCLVYSRKKRRGESSCTFTGETTIRGAGLDDAFVSKHDCGETRRRGNRSDNCLVYSRKKGRVKFNSCTFSKHITGGTKIGCDQADSSACSHRGQVVKADSAFTGPNPGEIKKSGHQPVYYQSKQLVKSNGSFTESHVGKTKRNGEKSDVLLTYSRRKQRGKSVGVRVNGFLVYTRKKLKFRGPFARHDLRETKTNGDQLVDDTQVTEVTYSSDGTNDSCSSLKSSSEVDSSSSTTGEDGCYSSDAVVSETDTDGSSGPFRLCKHCDKPGTVEKMLICDECEEAYHTICCGVQMKDIAGIDDWLCPSCLKNKPSKTKTKGRISRERKWRVTVPLVIGVRIGKKFQADVPDWSGPTMSDTSFVGEPLEIDQSEYTHDLKKAKNSKKQCSAVNWLQCREEDSNGDICGKWRRAPRSEVQTKDWECFCCVFWDPSRADCAVPQELETSEILKQLKYIKMLRPRSDAKKRKLGAKGRSRSHNKGKS
ncbi:Zinc finger CW-type [Arabidopsis thaliana x Arabidopsis arenosa]|uniref:Zinc finger CW-type n=1 Tax=Arabidopsis thaliana x Arabidopsis arenosa TaxID=1240361 RepID=A0A8T2AYE5_9BRAS|nr:Zinc finger CW-type [Arabidopsis thaliana x Arabidopsis arenosa]